MSIASQISNAENNARAVVLSEELDFIEELIGLGTLDGDELRITLDRRDVVRDALITFRTADPDDEPVEGTVPPPDGTTDDEYDEDDTLVVAAEDDDHKYSPNRAQAESHQQCTVCGEPRSEHED